MKQASPSAGSTLTLSELRAQITELAGHLNAAQHRWLCLIAEFDRRQGWNDGATRTCAHWLNWQCGIDLGAAREKVRVAHALQKLPKIAAAMGRGQLSYSKVRALTRVACEKTEDWLLHIALHGTAAHVEKLVRQFRRAQEAEELSREARQQANRRVSYSYDDDGSLILKGRLPAEIGAQFVKALDAALEAGVEDAAAEGARAQMDPADVSAATSDPKSEWRGGICCADDKPSWGARRADALGRIAESFLKTGLQTLAPADRQQIIVHVDAQTLREGGAGRCELEDGPSLAVETARRLACDASTVHIHEDEAGKPLNVGRKTRVLPPALRRALKSRDQGCRFPGCPDCRYVDAHHIQHWAQGGETKLSNLVQLCRFHHRQVHEGRVLIERLDDGALRFLRSDGESFESAVPGQERPACNGSELQRRHRREGTVIDANTAATRWRGERMDYDLAVHVLLQQARREMG